MQNQFLQYMVYHRLSLVTMTHASAARSGKSFQCNMTKHVTSSPEYAQSNGKAEKGVHILKQLLKKAADSKSDPYLALLNYRTSSLECGMAPAEMLMNLKLRTSLPSCSKQKANVKIKQKRRNSTSTAICEG